MRPMAEKYADLAGYRKLGLVYVPPPPSLSPPILRCANTNGERGCNSADDLIVEENDIVQEALKRLPPKVVYDRMFRMRRAVQVCCVSCSVPSIALLTCLGESAPLPILYSRRRSRRSPSRTSAICRRISRRSSVRLLRGTSSIR